VFISSPSSCLEDTKNATKAGLLCEAKPPNLLGPINVSKEVPTFEELLERFPNISIGGHGEPERCVARHKVAIIVPYRDREEHLRTLLNNLHPFLSRQQLDYTIYIIEQKAGQTFNRGKLMNVGFMEALKLDPDLQCFIFHDVDLLPENDHNMYSCPKKNPRHMSVAINNFNYKLPYKSIFGGVSALTKDQFERLNGFSNDYWGWGGEDDDMSTRVNLGSYEITRYPDYIARYYAIPHEHEKSNPVNPCRYTLLKNTRRRWQIDGLSDLDYRIESIEQNRLYTKVLVDLLENESRSWISEVSSGKCFFDRLMRPLTSKL